MSDPLHPEPPVIEPRVGSKTAEEQDRSQTSSTIPDQPPLVERSPVALPSSDVSPTSEELVESAPRQAIRVPPVLPPPSSSDRQDLTSVSPQSESRGLTTISPLDLLRFPIWLLGRSWDIACLFVLLAVVAAVPLIQLASLGYLLTAAANLAQRRPWASCFPGLRLAGKIGTFVLLATLAWLPVWLVTDLAYSAQLLRPGSNVATGWRVGAFAISGLWLMHISWAAMRGGRWWHMLWPAPVRFVKQVWRPNTWSKASDQLYELVVSLQFPTLWWLGARAAVGALLWVTLPVSLMIIGQRAEELSGAGLVGFIGAIGMTFVMLYLPFLQIQMAADDHFSSLFNVRKVRRRFRFAPWAHALSLLMLCVLCIPLYLLRIEATPAELLWAPSLVFVLFMLPAKILLGAAMGFAEKRKESAKPRHWTMRWSARFVGLASVLIYVGALYVAQLIAGQGAFVMYFQHAFLVPAPLI